MCIKKGYVAMMLWREERGSLEVTVCMLRNDEQEKDMKIWGTIAC
jgi:hypothetical protein